MVLRIQFILTAYIVYSALTFGQTYDQGAPDHGKDGREVRENFQNLFSSIANDNTGKGDLFRRILRAEVTREKRAFDGTNIELRILRYRNARKIKNTNVAESLVLRKRETKTAATAATETTAATTAATAATAAKAAAKGYTQNRTELEILFRKLHQGEKNVTWKDIGNLNPRTHKQLCDDVLKHILPPDRDYNSFSYYITLHEYLHEEKVIVSAQLALHNETVLVTTVYCEYEEIRFYVTRADDDHVFTLVREQESGIFHLKAGLHPVQPNYTIAMTFDIPPEPTTDDTGDI